MAGRDRGAAGQVAGPLAVGEFQQLQRFAAASAGYACRGCFHICEARFEGPVLVAKPLRHLMYHESYGEARHARDLYNRLSREERAFDGVDLRPATEACPQGIDTAARLEVARRKLDATE